MKYFSYFCKSITIKTELRTANLVNDGQHGFQFATSKNWSHQSPHFTPLFALQLRHHIVQVLVVHLELSSVHHIIKVFDQNRFDQFFI